MQFFVYSRHAIEALGAHDVPHVVISITTTANDRPRLRSSEHRRGVLRLSFGDIDRPSAGAVMFDTEHARAICAFVSEHRSSIECVVVHCDAGFSRSPAVAAALAKCLGQDDAEFFRRYQPNMHVYRTLIDAWNNREDLEHLLYASLLRDELVSLGDLCWECAQRDLPVDTELILRVIGRALSERVVGAGDFADGTFIPWSGDVGDIVARITASWRALGRDPAPGELMLFRRSRQPDIVRPGVRRHSPRDGQSGVMSRKRDDGDGPPNWGEQARLRVEGERLVTADDTTIQARAAELGVDARRLRAFVHDARRRRP